jgi:hypothetical protein
MAQKWRCTPAKNLLLAFFAGVHLTSDRISKKGRQMLSRSAMYGLRVLHQE